VTSRCTRSRTELRPGTVTDALARPSSPDARGRVGGARGSDNVSVRRIFRAWLVVALLVLPAACGGGQEGSSTEPTLPSALAEDLAARSDLVVARLRAGKPCAAAREARALEQAAEAAIAERLVPGALQPELLRTARALSAGIRCEVETTPAETVEEQAPPEDTIGQPGDDRCVQLEEELQALEEQTKELQERRHELMQELKDDKEERARQKQAIEEQKQGIEEHKRAIEEELRSCKGGGG
jgi:hypothetical protein